MSKEDVTYEKSLREFVQNTPKTSRDNHKKRIKSEIMPQAYQNESIR